MKSKLNTYDGTDKTPPVQVRNIAGLKIEGPMLWLASRNGICKKHNIRIPFREEFYRINGKSHSKLAAEEMIREVIESLKP